MKARRAAIVGALTITAAGLIQDRFQGDPISIVKIGTWLFLGSLVGIGVSKFLNRKR